MTLLQSIKTSKTVRGAAVVAVAGFAQPLIARLVKAEWIALDADTLGLLYLTLKGAGWWGVLMIGVGIRKAIADSGLGSMSVSVPPAPPAGEAQTEPTVVTMGPAQPPPPPAVSGVTVTVAPPVPPGTENVVTSEAATPPTRRPP